MNIKIHQADTVKTGDKNFKNETHSYRNDRSLISTKSRPVLEQVKCQFVMV